MRLFDFLYDLALFSGTTFTLIYATDLVSRLATP